MTAALPPTPFPQPPQPPPFLDVAALLEASQPRQRVAWFWYAVGVFLLIVLAGALTAGSPGPARAAVQVVSGLAMIALMVFLAVTTVLTVRRHAAEQQAIEGAGELVQLRRWPEAGLLLQEILSRPARTANLRTQALVYLSAVLARYHRFDDAIAVHDHVLEHGLVDEATAHGLRLGRAMVMLREDHLFDADRAISERAAAARGRSRPGWRLVEIYRDVKTGHPAEAANLFEARLPAIRDAGSPRRRRLRPGRPRYDLLGRPAEGRTPTPRAPVAADRTAPPLPGGEGPRRPLLPRPRPARGGVISSPTPRASVAEASSPVVPTSGRTSDGPGAARTTSRSENSSASLRPTSSFNARVAVDAQRRISARRAFQTRRRRPRSARGRPRVQ